MKLYIRKNLASFNMTACSITQSYFPYFYFHVNHHANLLFIFKVNSIRMWILVNVLTSPRKEIAGTAFFLVDSRKSFWLL